MKIVTIVGARPQFIKAAAVSRALSNVYSDSINEILVHTGQHFDENMSDIFFSELEIPEPKYNLGIGGGTHGQNTGRMLESIERVLQAENPDYVLVYGDTDSTLAGALSAVKLHIPVAHIEAGLRSFNRRMPEEINRILTDHTADLLFAPTARAVNNLLSEGIDQENIQNVGDVMYDVALYYAERADTKSGIISNLGLESSQYILATIHRQENTDERERMANIIDAFATSNYPVVWPVHPRTRKRLSEFGLELPVSVQAIDPVGYFDMIVLEKNALMIATDSGGVQKEAYFHQTPCVTLRDETEWLELVDCGANVLVGADKTKIEDALGNKSGIVESSGIYGDGNTAKLIANRLISKL
ncbi:MAG: UDP-N-acetylglucosamine 2-epimerase (non-hydrolyzing) [Candidatus Sedimenticola sp. 6PFRAG1]